VIAIASLVIVVLVLVSASFYFIYPSAQICRPGAAVRSCDSYHILFVALWYLHKVAIDYAAEITGLATILIAAFTATLWWTTRETLRHLSRQFETEQRPWIPPDVQLASGWRWTPEQNGEVTLRLTFRNTGGTPAMDVGVRTKIFPLPGHPPGFLPDPVTEQRRLYEGEGQNSFSSGSDLRGLTIFPGAEPAVKDLTLTIPAAEIVAHLGRTRGFPGIQQSFRINSDVTPVIVGTISYHFTWNHERHQTGFIIVLKRVDPGDPHTLRGIDPNLGYVPQDDLRISDYYRGSAIID
jgi:hypothetical protein